MGDLFFIIALAFIWVIYASISDLKTREVPNWLSFSLISFALAYRLFYSINTGDYYFFLIGLIGAAVGFGLAMAFYYGKVFAGGDAKLLIGFGTLIPPVTIGAAALQMIAFLFILFLSGSIYSLIFSFYLVLKKPGKYWKNFIKEFGKQKSLIFAGIGFAVLFLIMFSFTSFGLASASFFILLPLLYTYLKALENVCFIKKVSPQFLAEGDWLEKEIMIGKIWIRKSVHGLSYKDIQILKKAKREVWVRDGIPFIPAFLISLVIMVSFWAFYGPGWLESILGLF
jgi:Flp pilus assembly protein protease CpaA